MADRNALWEQGQDESVEVNQRALIDKVLARYSGEFTVFRELLQNADDAGSSAVQIHFESRAFVDRHKKQQPGKEIKSTDGASNVTNTTGSNTPNAPSAPNASGASNTPSVPGAFRTSSDSNHVADQPKDTNLDAPIGEDQDKPLPSLKDLVIVQWTFKNNGTIFREEDWARLKKIAEGNPDEQKIGAFGVGFYSLFSVTEEPFVTSGPKWMGFYWKDGKDQLFARRGNLPADSPDSNSQWTTFTLPLRQATPLPGAPLDMLRFLASSITFMATLKDVELYLDGIRLGRISKDVGSPQPIGVPQSLASSQTALVSSSNYSTPSLSSLGNPWDWALRGGSNTSKPQTEKNKETKWNWLTPRKYFTLNQVTSTPVHIRAEVIRWVYLAGSEKPKPVKKAAPAATSANAGGNSGAPTNSFLASLISSFASPRSNTPSRPLFASGRSTPTQSSTTTPQVKPKAIPAVDTKKIAADQRKIVESSVLLSVFNAEAKVKLDDKMSAELERATKKRAPPTVKVGLIYTGKDEYDASEKEDLEGAEGSKDVGSVFLGLRADLEGNNSSRVYIGHATGQTTGISGHMSARFIPTVERESIDLVDRNVSIWNTELLHVGGYLSRVAYETELAAIARLYSAALETSGVKDPDNNLKGWLQSRCLHALKFFTYRPSTPSPDVSRIMQSAFFAASDNFSIFSTAGVKPASTVRVRSPDMEKFVKALPVLPKEIQDGASDVVALLQGRNMIKQITFDDIIAEMRGRCFEEEEMVECLKWRVGLPRQAAFDAHFRDQFLSAGIFRISGDGAASKSGDSKDSKGQASASGQEEKIVPLASIASYINPSGLVPLEGPYPSTVLPLRFSTTKGLQPTSFSELFGWSMYSINDWLGYLVSKPPAEAPTSGGEHDITASPLFTEKVLMAIAKGWSNISKANQEDIVAKLTPVHCVPTQLGLKQGQDAYFSSVHVFSDLPMVTFSPNSNALTGRFKGPMEALLSALGVRKHVDLQLVFNRMIKTGDWTIPQLVKYLASVKDTLTPLELERLKQTAAFMKEEKEEKAEGASDTKSIAPSVSSMAASTATATAAAKQQRRQRFKIIDLYEPTDAMRELGLPILDWGDNPKWRFNSDEAKFLYSLGLRKYPPLPDLLRLASTAGTDAQKRELALKYFFDKYQTQYQDFHPVNFAEIAFIPAVRPDGTEFLAKHSQVFAEPGDAVLGFAAVKANIKDEALTKLKILRHPPAAAVTSALLSNPPRTEEQARKVFEYLTNLLGDFTTGHLQQLKNSNIIPAIAPGSTTGNLSLVKPGECYFKREDGQTSFHSKLFTFIDFGTRANNFLAACGVRSAPTTDEVARMLVADPHGFYKLTGSAERFKAELRQMAASFAEISAATRQMMKRAPVLLGTKIADETESTKKGERRGSVGVEMEDDTITVSYELLRPDQIVIIDDVNTYSQFKEVLYGAPQEDILEQLYESLGSPRLGQLIKEEYKPVGEMRDAPDAAKLRKLVLERLPLFLHERNQGRVLIRLEWMQNTANFIVKKVARLILQKTLVWGGRRVVKDSEASAAAKREGFNRTLNLYVAHNIPLDLYEVANSLCKQIFDVPKVNDSLLFSTILSTDLPSLRRRGYNVDRILNQQKAEREARESARRAAEREAEREAAQFKPPGAFVDDHSPEPQAKNPSGPAPPVPANKPGAPIPDTAGSTPAPHVPTIPPPPGSSEKDKHGRSGLFNSMKNKLSSKNISDDFGNNARSSLDRLLGNKNSPGGDGLPGMNPPSRSRPGPGLDIQPTPESDINKNVQQAINACRPEARSLIQNRQHMETINEALNEGYCDISGMDGDLILVGNIAGIKIYAGKDVPNPQDLLLRTKLDSINRFLTIVNPLKRVYKLPNASVHIFYNLSGPVIAFNAGGSLFLNLRYHEGWHDAQVANGEPTKAMISWFFTLAHEISHNLVGPHNAEHSYYMNQISQAHLLNLIDELQTAQFGLN